MPLYEYECRGCGKHFEYLTREGRSPECPACHGADLQKQLSVFAVGADTSGGSTSRVPQGPAGPCGSCSHPGGPGSCSMN